MSSRTFLTFSSGCLAAAACVACAAGATSDRGSGDVRWAVRTPWQGDGKVECVRIGDADPASPGPEVVGVDDAGRVIVVRFPQTHAEAVFRHTARLTGLLVADVDPSVPGEEIYAGGYADGERGGAVFQVVIGAAGDVRTRRVFAGDAFVHAMGRLPAGGASPTPQLLIADYAATVHLATPAPGGGAWPSRVVHREPPTDAFEGAEMKDVVVGPIGGGGPRTAFVAVKSGRGVVLDVDRGVSEVAHVETGGIARAALADDGSLWLAGTDGRLVHAARGDDGAWRAQPVFADVGGLRGVALGRFPAPGGGAAPVAVFGYANAVRLVRPGAAGTHETVTVFDDVARGHWLAAADLVPGDDADELALASYAGAIRVLVAERSSR